MTPQDTVKRLTGANPDITARYEASTHKYTVYLTIHSAMTFESWQEKALDIRRQLTMRQSTLIPEVWTPDSGAPGLNTTPETAIRLDERTKTFRPMVNICIWRQFPFLEAQAKAVDAANAATLYLQRHKTMPTAKDVDFDGDVVYKTGSTATDAAIADTLSRINT